MLSKGLDLVILDYLLDRLGARRDAQEEGKRNYEEVKMHDETCLEVLFIYWTN